MADDRHPLHGDDPFNRGVRIERLPPRACWSLQAEPSCWATLREAAGLGDVAVPATGPWQASGHDFRWLQLGPQEAWLLPRTEPHADSARAANQPLASTQAAFRAQGLVLACVAIGDAWVARRLQGPGLIDLLAHGCPLDVGWLDHPGHWSRQDHLGQPEHRDHAGNVKPPARRSLSGCVRTRLAQAPVVIAFDEPTDGEPSATLWAERSHATYVDRWLETTRASLNPP